MSTVQIISDLHCEFEDDGGEDMIRAMPVNANILIVAGDLVPLRHEPSNIFRMLCERFDHVIYVLGNHEYYGTSPILANRTIAQIADDLQNLHVLNPGIVEIDGIRFVGATLWFPPTPDEIMYRHHLNDFNNIRNFLPWVHDTHAHDLKFLEEKIQPGDVVITHHLPHEKSIAPCYAGSRLNRFFLASDAMPLVEKCNAKLWIHGHTHTGCDYKIGNTNIICNPKGYRSENHKFKFGLIKEI